MNTDLKRKSDRGPYHPDERARRHQEEALDDALKHTFPASDPISMEQPGPTQDRPRGGKDLAGAIIDVLDELVP